MIKSGQRPTPNAQRPTHVCALLLITPATPLEGTSNSARIEPLADERAEQPALNGWIPRVRSAPEPFVERLLEQRPFIHAAEHVGHGQGGRMLIDAERAEFAQHALAAVPLHVRVRPGRRQRNATIVQRAGRLQPCNRLVHRIPRKTAAGEPLAHLFRRQLAPREHREPRGVSLGRG